MGAVVDRHEPYSIESETIAIVLIVEADELAPHARGISTPKRIARQTWPTDAVLTEPALCTKGRIFVIMRPSLAMSRRDVDAQR